MAKKLEGILSAALTPFDERGELQEDILREHIDFLVKSGVNVLAVLGTIGEGPSMSIEQRKEAARIIVDATGKRIPVNVHIGAADTATTIELAKHAETVGADALYCVPPYYYVPDHKALIEHFRMIASSVSLPLYVYHIPETTKINVTPELLMELAKIPGLKGIKFSDFNLVQMQDYIDLTEGKVEVFNGKDGLIYPALMLGAVGHFSGLATTYPEPFVELWSAFKARDYERAHKMQKLINSIRRVIAKGPYIETLKEALRARGYRMGFAKMPLRTMTDAEKKQLHEGLRALGVLKPKLQL